MPQLEVFKRLLADPDEVLSYQKANELREDQSSRIFLLGDKRFTTFVELKTPETPLFSKPQNRPRAWRLSGSLFDSVSQILEQEASGLLKFERDAPFDEKGQKITQRPPDPKVVLLFRRDSRNVEIVTYDELFERAQFIASHRDTQREGTPGAR